MEKSSPTPALPWIALIALMLGPFAFSTGAFVFGGLLAEVAAGLEVSVSAAAQLQTGFTLACAVGGPALAIALAKWDKRRLLIVVALFLTAVGAASALVQDYWALMAVRVAGGFVGALTVPLAPALAVGLVSEAQRSRALAVVSGGTALALLFGIPAGSLIGGALGWQAAFWFSAILNLVAAGAIALLVPPAAPAPAAPGLLQSPIRWPLTGFYLSTLLAFVATFSTVGLIGPLITALTGLTGGAVGGAQVLVGIGAVAGLALGALLAERRGPRALPILFAVIVWGQGIYVIALTIGAEGIAGLVFFALGTLPGATALFATFPVIATALAARAGAAATLAFAINGATIFLGQGVGVAVGTIGFGFAGLQGASMAGTLVALVGFGFALRLRSV
ncbi:MAG: MFS transporter [Pseudomonadota bacterium]